MTSEILGLQWLEHPSLFNEAIGGLRNKSSFTDATLACEGKFYPVHKFVLSTCSEYFNAIFEWTPCVNPVVVINNIPSNNLESLLDFMYRGEANVHECHIQDVMKAAECLHIKGLSLRQEESILTKNRARSPINLEEPKRKRRKSESKKKPSSFVKPQLQGDIAYSQQATSPIQSCNSLSTRPTPTSPLTTPIHQTSPHSIVSPHHTPSVNSPSLHSTSPLALSSTASSPSQTHLHSTPSVFIPSSKSLLIPVSQGNVQNQQTRMMPQFFKESTINCSTHLQSIPQPIDTYQSHSSQPRDQYVGLKDEQSSLVLSTLPNISAVEPTILPMSEETVQFRKFATNMLSSRTHEDMIHHTTMEEEVQSLSQIDPKMIRIGEEIHLDSSVKELQIATEHGTVTIPEILEGLVDMRHLYDTKVSQPEEMESHSEGFSRESKHMEIVPQCLTSGTPVTLLQFKEETNNSMYEFSEDMPETSGMGKINMLKDKNLKTYSSNGANAKKKNDQLLDSLLLSPSSNGETSKAGQSESSSSSSSVSEKKEVKGPFLCRICSRIYKKKEGLTRHMRTHTEFPYICTVCDMKCKMYKELIAHRKIHATKKCTKCDFVTIRNDNLRRHMQGHSDEKTLKCSYPECSYSSDRSAFLSAHILNHHKKKQVKKDESDK